MDSPPKGPVMRTFNVFFLVIKNKLLHKPWSCWWFGTTITTPYKWWTSKWWKILSPANFAAACHQNACLIITPSNKLNNSGNKRNNPPGDLDTALFVAKTRGKTARRLICTPFCIDIQLRVRNSAPTDRMKAFSGSERKKGFNNVHDEAMRII